MEADVKGLELGIERHARYWKMYTRHFDLDWIKEWLKIVKL